MIKTVVFDLDDTLYDEVEYCKSGFRAVADFLANQDRRCRADIVFEALWRRFAGGDRTRTFNSALEEIGVVHDAELIKQLVKVYRNHEPEIELPADSRQVLERLSGKYTLALLTDGFLPAQQLKLRALGIEAYFRCIVYTEQLGRAYWKPSPVGFERLIERLGARPQETAYIADNEEKDFIAPNKLGFLTVQIIRPAGVHKASSNLPGAKAGHRIRQISELQPILESA
jgi:putative hydrolase of the HAD superfamily